MGGVCCRPEVRHPPSPHTNRDAKSPHQSLHQPIDFDGEVNLFHFVLLRSVGKGAFGKVRSPPPTIRGLPR